ncbi:uncharacterized protein LOC126809546 [Patella vulgata]|uniref:uncharacterized protein LOC126809546 n=1 Tax=Patella vulgata TaxID=6465 RepID=UPI0024A9406F|nr:uncharacterized protein LOC126809546 [Patella vulgata]
MASAETKREERRRKILQNSEDRMRKLLGQTGKDIEKDNIPPNSEFSLNKSKTTIKSEQNNIDQALKSSINNTTADVLSESKKESTIFNSLSLSREPIHKDKIDKPVVKDKKTLGTGIEHPVNQKTDQLNKDDIQRMLDVMRLGLVVLLAVVVRWILSFGFGIIFLQSMFVPFIITEIAFYAFHHMNNQEIILRAKGSLLSSALVLCGIKPELIATYNQIMGYVNAIVEDFATYLFAFLICNIFMGREVK